MSRRRTALLILLAGASSLAGWVVLAPAMSTRATAPARRPLVVDAINTQARQVAAIAGSSDGPRSPAGRAAVPTTAAASAGYDKARCGEDQLPVYATPEADGASQPELPVPGADGGGLGLPGEIKPAGVGYTGAQRRIDAALRATGDPFDRSVADWLNVDGVRTPSGQLDALVQNALQGNDARSYALAVESCNDASPGFMFGQPRPATTACASVSVGEWARRDPGNALPWLYALRAADAAGDRAAQDDALTRMASARRFDLYWGAGPAAVARLPMSRDADLAAQVGLAMQAVSVAPLPPWGELMQRCRDQAGGDPGLARLCDAIGGKMFDHSDTLLARAFGASLQKQATGDARHLEQVHRERAALAGSSPPDPGPAPCAAEHEVLRYFVHVAAVGELAAAREQASASAVH